MRHIQAVIFDWAGTVVDFGCFAPMDALMQSFAQAGVPITAEEAREPMGLLKRDHIQAILRMERVKQAWQGRFGRYPNASDGDRLYEIFEAVLMASLHRFTDPIPGVLDVVDELRGKGLKIGSTTGYTRKMMEVVRQGAKEKGYEPDYVVASDEVRRGRPYPDMIFQNLIGLDVHPPKSAVKVGDTVADVKEGKNAGVWSVAVVKGSSELGLTLEEMKRCPEKELEARIQEVRRKFEEAGADYVMESMEELPSVLDILERQM
jgi:phosphonoacetaldehyde hydrolase